MGGVEGEFLGQLNHSGHIAPPPVLVKAKTNIAAKRD